MKELTEALDLLELALEVIVDNDAEYGIAAGDGALAGQIIAFLERIGRKNAEFSASTSYEPMVDQYGNKV